MKYIPVNNLPSDVVEDVVGVLANAGQDDKALALQKSVDRSRRSMGLVSATFDTSFDVGDLTAGAIGAFLVKEYGVDYMADKFPMFDSTLGTWVLVTLGAAGAVISWRVINHQVLGRLAGVGKFAALHEEDVREELKAKTGEKRVAENKSRMSGVQMDKLLGRVHAAEDEEDEEVLDDNTVLTVGMIKELFGAQFAEAALRGESEPEIPEKRAKPITVGRTPKVKKVKKAASGN
jgi:hypothetical protein